ncbi:unnamed protein product [Ilex paraguariensis]|uniref:RING-type domain-containing protein n=1 Tax=Ilex paraguariensis TaxID=185542 RepID=A0ABC8T4A7_9AQUA
MKTTPAMICCCLPCIISILGICPDMVGMRGASDESINALPTHNFKLKRNVSGSSRDNDSEVGEGGFVAAGTEKERAISGEDEVCCIFLARYTDNDGLRELPCSHFFHTECLDKWLKINASCPLYKFEIGDSNVNSSSTTDSNQININAVEAKLITSNNLPLNVTPALPLVLAFESELEPVSGEEDDKFDDPGDEVDVEAKAGGEHVAVLVLEPASASLKIFASGESGGNGEDGLIDRFSLDT